MHEHLRHFGKRLRELRLREGFTQKELADKLGVVQGHVATLESAKEGRQPSIEFLLAVGRFFGVGLDDLMGIDKSTLTPREIDNLPPEVKEPIEQLISQLSRQQREDRWRVQSGLTYAIAGEAGLAAASRALGVVVSPEDDRLFVEQ